MKYLSLFSGIGGFELGIQQAYEQIYNMGRFTEESNTENRRHKSVSDDSNGDGRRSNPCCIGFSEIDKYAIETYQSHFNHKNYGDITTIITNELPDFDLLVGGFPCQAFSIAGKRKGFEDTRGTLFFEIARILRDKQPRLFCLENVKGLLSHDNGQTFRTIISTLDELGYDIQWQVLNSKNFGVPQNRERVFIIGHLRGTSRPQVFPFGSSDQKDNMEVRVKGKLRAFGAAPPVLDKEGISPTIVTAMGTGGNNMPCIEQLNNPTHSNDRVYGKDGLSPTLNTMQGGNRQPFIPEDSKIRRLTPTECERLQGFPDNWTIGSDTQRYKQCGNAVTVNVIEEIMKRLLK